MFSYNLSFELAALFIMCVLLVNFIIDKELHSKRYVVFRGMCIITFINISVTLITMVVSDFYMHSPLWLVDLANMLYFILLPSPAIIYFFYVIILTVRKPKFSRLFVLFLPYLMYVLIILSNLLFRGIYTVTPENGYIRGDLYQLPYLIVLIYVIFIVIAAIKYRNTIYRGIATILCLSLLFSSALVAVQVVFPEVVMSGIGSALSMLFIHLYIQNESGSKDELTGLNSRKTLVYHMTRFTEAQQPFSLYVFSIRNFKTINERHGLAYGDLILQEVASHFTSYFKRKHLYRYSGDEFALISFDLAGSSVISKEKNILAAADRFNSAFSVEGEDCLVGLVYTRVDFPEFGSNTRELISAIDYSINILKKQSDGSNFYYDTSVYNRAKRINKIVERLKYALDHDGFDAYYQPILAVETGNFSEAEALIRIKNNGDDPIYPDEFIPIAEEKGLIVDITYIMVKKACESMRKIYDEYGGSLCLNAISVNFPYAQFLKPDMEEKVSDILNSYNIPTHRLKIEITERTIVSDTNITRETMEAMQSKGYVFELDDFGVDYSNLNLILNLPVSIIKVDKSLVGAILSSSENMAFFERFVQGIKATNRTIVVEGVETEEAAKYFIDCGCEFLQGFVFSKPLPFTKYLEFLKAHNDGEIK